MGASEGSIGQRNGPLKSAATLPQANGAQAIPFNPFLCPSFLPSLPSLSSDGRGTVHLLEPSWAALVWRACSMDLNCLTSDNLLFPRMSPCQCLLQETITLQKFSHAQAPTMKISDDLPESLRIRQIW